MSIYAEMNHTNNLLAALHTQRRELCVDREANAEKIKAVDREIEKWEDELSSQRADARAEAKADAYWDERDDYERDYEDEDEDE